MQLAFIDWVVIVVCLAAAFAPALFYARRASRNTTEFFASGRTAPWWLIGTSMGLFIARKGGLELSSHAALVWSVALTTVVWVTVTFATPPTDTETLRRFYRKVRPAGRGWTRVVGDDAVSSGNDGLSLAVLGWVLGCTFVYATLFGTGALLYGQSLQGALCLAVATGAGLGLVQVVPKIWNEKH
jgi:Na+/proline symporter